MDFILDPVVEAGLKEMFMNPPLDWSWKQLDLLILNSVRVDLGTYPRTELN